MEPNDSLDSAVSANSDPVGIVLGSGLGPVASRIVIEKEVPFSEAGMPESRVEGHAGRFLIGKLGKRRVAVMQGRLPLYEGSHARDVTAGIRWLHVQGVREVMITNAAGSLNRKHQPGEWMMISDHLNLTATSPLEGSPQFVDMGEIYSRELRNDFRCAANRLGLALHEGVYAGIRGPQYETPAEIRMLGTWGADAVGMSTVLEAIQAKALGMEVAGFSCLTNRAAGMADGALDHADVIRRGGEAAVMIADLLEAWCAS